MSLVFSRQTGGEPDYRSGCLNCDSQNQFEVTLGQCLGTLGGRLFQKLSDLIHDC
jgi:hypothetical protein